MFVVLQQLRFADYFAMHGFEVAFSSKAGCKDCGT